MSQRLTVTGDLKTGQLSDYELIESLRAGVTWSKTRDVPDIINMADFASIPEAGLPAMKGRLARFPSHANSESFPLPKASGKMRRLLYADPFDEAIYRGLVGQFAPLVDFQLHGGVQSYRLAGFWPTWRFRSYKYGDANRRGGSRDFATSSEFGAIAKIDVKEYYPSIELPALASVLTGDLEIPPADVLAVVELLREWQENWGVRGVPIGPEASGILGNAMLVPLDRALERHGIDFFRFTDDVTLLLKPEDRWDEVRALVESELDKLGLELNEAKTIYVTDPLEAELHVGGDRTLDAVTDLLSSDPAEGVKRVRWLFDSEVDRPDPSVRRLNFMLKVLANRCDDHALPALQHQDRLWRMTPTVCGHYVARLHARGLCDQDWLVGQATAMPTSATGAAMYHQLLALREGRYRLPKPVGDELREMALASPGLWMPLRVAAADVIPKTTGWKPAESLAAARYEVGHLQRALVASVRHGSTPSRRDLAKLKASDACLPTLAWLESGAS